MTGPSNLPDDSLPFFLAKNSAFSSIKPEDDLLHPNSFANIKDDSATETQYFGFSVPQEHIHALAYMWWHPNLGIVTGGLLAFQGTKPAMARAELCDWRNFMSDAAIRKNDLHEFRFDNGYGVKIIEPLKKFHLTYADPANGNSADVMIEAVLPPVMFGDGNHFEQTMKVDGELVLRGKRYRVDCFTVRDRSWGKPRQENTLTVPPVSWMVGTFNRDFSFNCAMFDHVSGQPERNSQFVMPDDKALNGGWVYRDRVLGRIVTASKRVIRGAGSTFCSGIDLKVVDEHGRKFDFQATLVASCLLSPWNNMLMHVNLMRWECDGLVGYGDNQEGFWGAFLNSPQFKALA